MNNSMAMELVRTTIISILIITIIAVIIVIIMITMIMVIVKYDNNNACLYK